MDHGTNQLIIQGNTIDINTVSTLATASAVLKNWSAPVEELKQSVSNIVDLTKTAVELNRSVAGSL